MSSVRSMKCTCDKGQKVPTIVEPPMAMPMKREVPCSEAKREPAAMTGAGSLVQLSDGLLIGLTGMLEGTMVASRIGGCHKCREQWLAFCSPCHPIGGQGTEVQLSYRRRIPEIQG